MRAINFFIAVLSIIQVESVATSFTTFTTVIIEGQVEESKLVGATEAVASSVAELHLYFYGKTTMSHDVLKVCIATLFIRAF